MNHRRFCLYHHTYDLVRGRNHALKDGALPSLPLSLSSIPAYLPSVPPLLSESIPLFSSGSEAAL